MKIDGKQLADSIFEDVSNRVVTLKKNGIVPKFAILQVGDNSNSTAYIKQKRSKARKYGVISKHFQFSRWTSFQKIAETIHRLNLDDSYHGVVMQLPLPPALSTGSFNQAVQRSKDIDGFRPKSPFRPPVARAVIHILNQIYEREQATRLLKTKKIIIVGRGKTGGKPIADELASRKIPHIILHSKTINKKEFYETADIIITCVGKKNIIPSTQIKENVVLISVGLSETNGKFASDYDEKKVAEKAAYYTPTPGGIGPLTVAFLLENVVKAAEKKAEPPEPK